MLNFDIKGQNTIGAKKLILNPNTGASNQSNLIINYWLITI